MPKKKYKSTEAQLKAYAKYNANVERISLVVPTGTKKRIAELGFTYSEFINDMIQDELQRLEQK